MHEFAQMAGVPPATIKHYVREGLIPEPHRTGKTVAWYNPAWSARIQAIKQLQQRLFLPLPVIRDLLDELGDVPELPELAVLAAIARTLDSQRGDESRTRAQLLAAGMPEAVLDGFVAMGVVRPRRIDGELRFEGDDLELLRTLKQAREVGLSPEMLPPAILADYMRAVAELVRVELDLFQRGVLPRLRDERDAGRSFDEIASLTEHATRLSERLVVLLRRQLLQPTLRELLAEAVPPSPPTPGSPLTPPDSKE